MRRLGRGSGVPVGALLLLLAGSGALAVPESGAAFSRLAVGERAPATELATLDGSRAPLFRSGARTNVFVFLDPAQESTEPVLETLAKLEKRFAKDSVYFCLVVSDTAERGALRGKLDAHRVGMPVLVDDADALEGRLGVVVFPSVGILDAKGTLLRYQFFLKVNFFNVLEAEIQHALGRIDDAALDAVLHPSRPAWGGEAAASVRYVKLAEMQLEAGQPEKAAESAKHAIDRDPKNPSAHGIAAAAAAAAGNCDAALTAAREALALDAREAHALAARERCAAR